MGKRLSESEKLTFILIIVFLIAIIAVSCGVSNSDAKETGKSTEGTSEVAARDDETGQTSDLSATEPEETPKPSATESETSDRPDLTLLPPVETSPPNTKYEAAFAGQTRAPGTATKTTYDVSILSEELQNPWAVAALPDGRLAITEKAGSLRILSVEGQLSPPIGGFPNVDSRKQGGLLDVAAAPDFLTSRMLYFTLAEAAGQGSLTAVGRGRLADDETGIENFEIIWRAVPYFDNSMHFGSRLVFDQDGYIFATTGERSDLKTRPNAQLLDNGHGKVVRITTEGDPAPGNPFVDEEGVLPEIYTYGHRNVQGLAIQPESGEVWISEMGPRGGDELNLIKPGGNYGWPEISYGIEYSGQPLPGAKTEQTGMEQPVYYWDPSLAPSGMTFYSSGQIAEWQGNLFIGGLVSRHISRLVLDGGRVIAEERLLAEENQRFRDVGEGADGALYAVTDGGRLYRISQE